MCWSVGARTSAVVTDTEGVRQRELFSRQRIEACKPIPVLVKPGKARSQVLFGEEAKLNTLLEDWLPYCLISVQKGKPALGSAAAFLSGRRTPTMRLQAG